MEQKIMLASQTGYKKNGNSTTITLKHKPNLHSTSASSDREAGGLNSDNIDTKCSSSISETDNIDSLDDEYLRVVKLWYTKSVQERKIRERQDAILKLCNKKFCEIHIKLRELVGLTELLNDNLKNIPKLDH